MLPTAPATPYVQRPPIPGGPPAPHPAGSPAYAAPPPFCPQPLHTPPAAHGSPHPTGLPYILPPGAARWAAPAPSTALAAPDCAAPGLPRLGAGVLTGPRGGPRPPHRKPPALKRGCKAGTPGAAGPCPQCDRRRGTGAADGAGPCDGAPRGPPSPCACGGAAPAPGDGPPPVPLPPVEFTRQPPGPRICEPRQG